MTERGQDLPGGVEGTLEAYRRAKWAELSDVGEDALRRELSELEAFLQRAGEHEWAGEHLVAFRKEKARILREVLEEAD